MASFIGSRENRGTTQPLRLRMDKGIAPELANLCHNLTETSQWSSSENKGNEMERPGEEGLLLFLTEKDKL